jgi:hypothetical protein
LVGHQAELSAVHEDYLVGSKLVGLFYCWEIAFRDGGIADDEIVLVENDLIVASRRGL